MSHETQALHKLLTRGEVSVLLRMSPRAVARLAALGDLPEVRVSPRKVFYRAADVLTVMGETPELPSPPKRTKHAQDLAWEFADHPYPIRDVTPA